MDISLNSQKYRNFYFIWVFAILEIEETALPKSGLVHELSKNSNFIVKKVITQVVPSLPVSCWWPLGGGMKTRKYMVIIFY
jgi:hypothetical protein